MASLLGWLGNAARDLVDANTEDDQKRRLAQGQPRYYQQQQARELKRIEHQLFEKKNIDPSKTCFKCGQHQFKLTIKIIPTGKDCTYCHLKFYI